MAPADPADPDRVAPANREAPVDREAPAVPADLAGPEDTSRAARAGTADMGLVAPANRVDRAALVGMSPVIQADRVAPANLVGMRAVVQADRVALARPDPGQNRALLDRNPVHLRRRLPDPTRAHPHRMRARPHPHLTRAHPHRTPARPQEQTHPEVATHRPVPIHPAEETHLAEVIRPVEATHPAEEATHEADTEGVTLHYREFSSQSHGFENAATNCIGAPMNSWEGQHEDRAGLCCSGRGGRIGIIRFGRRDGGSSAAGPLPAMVPR
ncbi:MAG TPA: hypothetical protein VE485_14495 [Mycobacterium sp.]|nr:hypothetical protein [Mycobacterium sp.]